MPFAENQNLREPGLGEDSKHPGHAKDGVGHSYYSTMVKPNRAANRTDFITRGAHFLTLRYGSHFAKVKQNVQASWALWVSFQSSKMTHHVSESYITYTSRVNESFFAINLISNGHTCPAMLSIAGAPI